MANSRSDVMANVLANPPVKNTTSRVGSRVRVKDVLVVLDNTEAAGHLVPLARFSAFDRILKVEIAHATLAGATDVNVGPWTAVDWTLGDGVALDADILVDGYTMNVATANGHFVDMAVNAGAGQRTNAQLFRELWEDAGIASQLLANQIRAIDLVVQFITDPGAAATIAFRITYVAGD